MAVLKLFGLLIVALFVSAAIVTLAMRAEKPSHDAYRRSLRLGDDCLNAAKMADTAALRLDEAMRCVDLHPGTITGEAILRMHHDAIRELAQAK
jgi:hypothetical protein